MIADTAAMRRDRVVVVGRFVEFLTNSRPFDCNLYPSSLVSLCCVIIDPSNRQKTLKIGEGIQKVINYQTYTTLVKRIQTMANINTKKPAVRVESRKTNYNNS